MSYLKVIKHIQRVLNRCGDPVILNPTGTMTPSSIFVGSMTVEIQKVRIKQQNDCCLLPKPVPMCSDNPPGYYCINIVYIRPSLAEDYSGDNPLTDEEMRNMICTKTIFGCSDFL